MKYAGCYSYDIGRIVVVELDGAIAAVHIGGQLPTDGEERETELLREAASQLAAYFAGERKAFNLPLRMEGTAFQKAVWNALREIPYGETRSYKEIAQRVGNPNASRAVGMANHRNPIGIIVPCHRVVGADGKLTGYAGGIAAKDYLLQLERRNLNK